MRAQHNSSTICSLIATMRIHKVVSSSMFDTCIVSVGKIYPVNFSLIERDYTLRNRWLPTLLLEKTERPQILVHTRIKRCFVKFNDDIIKASL